MRTLKKKVRTLRSHNRSRSIHVCLVSSFPPSYHSLSDENYNLVKAFSRNPRISKITVLADFIDREEVLVDKKVDIIRCWKLNNIFASLSMIKKVYELKPDIVYYNLILRHFSSNRFINFLGYLAMVFIKKVLRNSVVVTLHNLGEPEAFDISIIGYRYSFINKLGIRLATKLILKADVVTFPHQHLVDLAKKKYNAKNVIYISNGLSEEPVLDSKLGYKRLLIFGRMGPYKGLETTFQAFRWVVNQDKEVKLIVAGMSHSEHPGFLESLLKKYSEIPNIELTGYVPENEIRNIFTSCTAVLLPYKMSVWSSGVFLLACTYGRPVIASDLPDFNELVKEGAGIFLFPVGDSERLAKAMESILNEKELQKRLGDANLKWAKKSSTIEQTTNRLVEIFEQLTGKKAEGRMI
jgi:glycosyltransferase involved in cell wall biosynthesis